MSTPSKLSLTLGFILGFAALAALFSWTSGVRAEVVGGLAAACCVAVFTLWVATLKPPR